MEIWSGVTIAGRQTTKQQTRKDRATQPLDHGRLRWAISFPSGLLFKFQIFPTQKMFSWPPCQSSIIVALGEQLSLNGKFNPRSAVAAKTILSQNTLRTFPTELAQATHMIRTAEVAWKNEMHNLESSFACFLFNYHFQHKKTSSGLPIMSCAAISYIGQ